MHIDVICVSSVIFTDVVFAIKLKLQILLLEGGAVKKALGRW